MNSTCITKKQLRRDILRRRNALPESAVRDMEKDSAERILAFIRELLPGVKTPRVMCYSSFKNEFPTALLNRMILENGWQLVLPYTDANMKIHPLEVGLHSRFRVSSLGISEPDKDSCPEADPSSVSLVLIPGVAFDERGFRIGFGAGCYDYFLPLLKPGTPVAALAHDFQIVPRIPEEPHDRPCDFIITEKRILNCAR